MDKQRRCGKRRIFAGAMAGLMALSAFFGFGSGIPGLTADAKEPPTAVAEISYEGLSEDGELSVIFTASDRSWEHSYTVTDGQAQIDGKATDATSISFPKEADVKVMVIADEGHQMMGCTVLNEAGVDLLVPQIKENVRNCQFVIPDVPDSFSIHAVVQATDQTMGEVLPLTKTNQAKALIESMTSDTGDTDTSDVELDYLPDVGDTIEGRGTIKYDHSVGDNTFYNGSLTSGDLAGVLYYDWIGMNSLAQIPGEHREVNADYIATCTYAGVSAEGISVAEFNVQLYTDEGDVVTGDQDGYQAVGGSIRVSIKDPSGTVILQKVSDHPEYTDNNPAYDKTGAKYGIYADAGCSQLLDTLTVQDNTGWTNESIELIEGTYYVKELPGSATGYQVSDAVLEIKVDGRVYGKQIVLNGTMAEPTKTFAMDALLQKGISDWSEAGKPEGDLSDFSGIQFTVSYYAGLYDSAKEALASGRATASAVFETEASGLLSFANAAPVSGSWPYQVDGQNVLPYGTVVLTERSTIDGLSKAGDPVAFTVTDDSKVTPVGSWPDLSTNADVAGTYENTIWKGSVTVYKADADSHSTTPQGDGAFDGISYEIINRSDAPVVVDGKEIAVDAQVMVLESEVTDGVATASSGSVLPYGTYEIRELSGNDSYNDAEWSQTFTIRSNGQHVSFGDIPDWNEDDVKRGTIQITKVDADFQASTPQGDADLAGASYDIYNQSNAPVYVQGSWYDKGEKVATVSSVWSDAENAYVATMSGLPYGTYEVRESGSPTGYAQADYSQTVQIREEGQVIRLNTEDTWNEDEVFRGGVSVTKADADLHESTPQGDATLAGTTYEIINRSANAVFSKETGETYAPGEVVLTLTTEWNKTEEAYMAATGTGSLPYGTYEIRESGASTGYNQATWSQTFTIREDGEMASFDASQNWNENPVSRGGIVVSKVDAETMQHLSLGEAHLDGATFEVINRSKAPVVVGGETFDVGDVVLTMAAKEMEWNGETIFGASTGNNVLPYGTYEIHEVLSGTGYLYNTSSQEYTQTVTIRGDGEMAELVGDQAIANQVIREDWHFQKKAADSMERMDQIAFLVTSMTTGEQHVIVTDENGTWGSAWVTHSQNTNANDPNSPNSNGAVAVDENGNWYVADSSKLTFDAGVWFTGLANDQVQWNEDGTSYSVNGVNVSVNDDLRAFPYDTYKVQELRCANNEGYKLVNFTVTLHRYTADHDGPGLDIDYGTIDDARISLGTTLTYNGVEKTAPAVANASLTDVVTFHNLDGDTDYLLNGELHLLNADGSDSGVVATAEKPFNSGDGIGQVSVDFTVDASKLAGKTVVAFEYLTENGMAVAEHTDLEDADQIVKFPAIDTVLTGSLEHLANGTDATITLTDTVSYQNLEPGKEFTVTDTLYDAATGDVLTDGSGNALTASKTFAPTEEKGSVDVAFAISGMDLSGKTVVAMTTLSRDGVIYAVHENLADVDQTVAFPSLDAYAVDGSDNNKDLAAGEGQIISVASKISNLNDAYEYRLNGTLSVRGSDGTFDSILTDADGEAIQASVEWKGTEDVPVLTFKNVDTSKLAGKDLVASVELFGRTDSDGTWVSLGTINRLDDEDLAVSVPKITTSLTTEQGLHVAQAADGTVTLTDQVSYINLTPGCAYILEGDLSDADSEDSLGEKAYTSFTAEEANGTANVTFTLDASELAGKTVVASETLYSDPASDVPEDWASLFPNGEDATFDPEHLDEAWAVAFHKDLQDEDQSVHFVNLSTSLTAVNGLHEMEVTGDTVTLTDTLTFENLIPGQPYTTNGNLFFTDGTPVTDGEGRSVSASVPFTPTEANGSVDVIFTINGADLAGKTVVATESLSVDDKVFASHEDLTDESQSVHFVTLSTSAKAENGLTITSVPEDGMVTITDEVSVGNVIPGTEYTIQETLHLQSVDADGTVQDAGAILNEEEAVTASATFTAEEANGVVPVTFTFDASGLEGRTVVAFASLYKGDVLVADHEDITAESQAVRFAELSTSAIASNGLQEMQVPEDGQVTITDRVSYTNLIPGQPFTLTSSFHIQDVDEEGTVTDGGAVTNKEDQEVLATSTFTPVTANGTTDVTFTFDASELAGKTVVVFETLSYGDTVILEHADITDAAQAIHFTTADTKAVTDNGTQMTQVQEGIPVIIVDTFSYTNLIPGMSYQLDGTIHLLSEDEEGNLTDGGEVAKAQTIFTADAAEGSVEVTFTFDGTELDGETVVVFETLSRDGQVIAQHNDLTDADQTIHFVRVRTRALAENDEHEMTISGGQITIEDLVEFKNLIPDMEYTVNGSLHMQTVDESGMVTDGGVFAVNDEEVVGSATFTPESADGSTHVTFTFNTDDLGDVTLVAFEEIYLGDAKIAGHTDIEDMYQTVALHPEQAEEDMTPPAADNSDTPSTKEESSEDGLDKFVNELPKYVDEIIKTGQVPFYGVLALVGVALIAGGGYLFVRKRRK